MVKSAVALVVQAATECLTMIGPQVGPYFQASTFLKFGCDAEGAISLTLLAQYITQHNSNMQLVRLFGVWVN
jgi:hypothetical protein